MKYKVGDVLAVRARGEYYKVLGIVDGEYILIYYGKEHAAHEFNCGRHIAEAQDTQLASKVEALLFTE